MSIPFLPSNQLAISSLNSHYNIFLNGLFSMNHHITPDLLVHESQKLFENVCKDNEPTSYEEATINLIWQMSMTRVWGELFPLPANKQVFECKWVYKVKHKANGSIKRLKSRLVVKGYTQQLGIDYTMAFSPVMKMTTVRSWVATAMKKSQYIYQLDVSQQCAPSWRFTCGSVYGDPTRTIHCMVWSRQAKSGMVNL